MPQNALARNLHFTKATINFGITPTLAQNLQQEKWHSACTMCNKPCKLFYNLMANQRLTSSGSAAGRASGRQTPAANLTWTMQLLHMTLGELETEISKVLEKNPALQRVEQLRCPECDKPVAAFPCRSCLRKKLQSAEDGPIVYLSPTTQSTSYNSDVDPQDALYESVQQQVSLEEHILKQVGPALNDAERKVAVHILCDLDEHGFWQGTPAHLVHTMRVRLPVIHSVLQKIQRCDPVGVACGSVNECLELQLELIENERQVPPYTAIILHEHLSHLSRGDYRAIASKLKTTVPSVQRAADFIHRNLTPYPAEAWTGSENTNRTFTKADVNIQLNEHEEDGPLMVEIYSHSGWLRVDPNFQKMLKQLPNETEKERWRGMVEQAALFAKCIKQRNNAMRQIMSIVVRKQRDYIVNGNAAAISLTRASIAKQIGVHESTVSRAIANKTARLPSGQIVDMAVFFDRSLAVREAVKSIVLEEGKPLTDQQISGLLLDRYNYSVARRTVAKYRTMLGILPASLRAKAYRERQYAAKN